MGSLFAAADVEGHAGVAVQAEFLVVVDFGFRGGVDGEVRLELSQFLSRGLDEHIEHEMGLPSHFHDEAHGHARVLVAFDLPVSAKNGTFEALNKQKTCR